MATKKRGLGKGLDALLSPYPEEETRTGGTGDRLQTVPVDLLQRSAYQPRTDFNEEAMNELADSIRAQGVVQPIVVRPISGNRYEIIAGERRWRAAQSAGLHEVPVVVREVDDRGAMCLALIENIQRQDLNPLDEARGLLRLLEEFEMTHDTVAEAVGKSRSTITNLLRLLDLTPQVKRMLEEGELEMGHARALLALADEHQVEAAREVARRKLSVRATEALVKKWHNVPAKKGRAGKADPDITRLENDLTERLGAPVAIRHKKTGKGTLEIRYNSLDELDGILSRIK